MPGRSPQEAVEAFLEPLRGALACVGRGHLTLSPGARGQVGENHSWVLNGGEPSVPIGRGAGLMARMNFEVLDRGSSRGDERFKVSTRSYLYSIQQESGEELVSAHWHPTGNSPVTFPHWHFGGPVLSETGVFLKRAHIPSPRIAFERVIRMAIEDVPGVEPTCDDWRDRLESTESAFDQYKSWD